MKKANNTVLITGGSAGIGFEMAKLFLENGNTVIITGRDKARLERAAGLLPGVTTIISDVSNSKDVDFLTDMLRIDFPQLNAVINNAGKAYAYKLEEGALAYDKAGEEMRTNYLAVINLTEKLLPLLSRQPEAAVVNVSSVVALVPGSSAPTYSASKAALHSYTQSLRIALKDTTVKVFELMPPLVNTDFSQEIGGANGIHPSIVAADLLSALEEDRYQIHVGQTEYMYQLSLSSPADALLAMNSPR